MLDGGSLSNCPHQMRLHACSCRRGCVAAAAFAEEQRHQSQPAQAADQVEQIEQPAAAPDVGHFRQLNSDGEHHHAQHAHGGGNRALAHIA